MGRSPTIADLSTQEKKLDDWLKGKEKDLEVRGKTLSDTQTKFVEDFYKKNKYEDDKMLVSGQNADFQHEKEFSLTNMRKVIEAIGKALFAGAEPPSGAEVSPSVAKSFAAATQNLTKVKDVTAFSIYIAGRVFSILSEVISSFGSKTALHYTHRFVTKPLGYGLQLFVTISADSYQATSFFHNENILEFFYLYEVRFSLDQSKSEGVQDFVKAYENSIALFSRLISKLDAQFENGEINFEGYKNQSDEYGAMMEKFDKKLQSLKADGFS